MEQVWAAIPRCEKMKRWERGKEEVRRKQSAKKKGKTGQLTAIKDLEVFLISSAGSGPLYLPLAIKAKSLVHS